MPKSKLTFRPEKNQYRDIDLNLEMNPLTNDVSTLSTNQSIHQSLKNLVLIGFYEKWFEPKIGNYVPSMLFELPIAEYAMIVRFSLLELIQKYEPRVLLQNGFEDITLNDENLDDNSIRVTINYLIIGKNTQQTTEVYVQRTK